MALDMRPLLLVVALTVPACKGGTGEPVGGSSVSGTSSAESEAPAPATDWSGKKLVTMEGVVDDIAFTIDIPEGLPREKRNQSDWDDNSPRFDAVPKVFNSTLDIKRVQSLDDAKYHGTLDARSQRWVREEAQPDSWAVTMAPEDKHRVEAIVYKQASDTHFIKCKAVQAVAEGSKLPNYEKTKAMLEAICDSLTPKGPVAAPADGTGDAKE